MKIFLAVFSVFVVGGGATIGVLYANGTVELALTPALESDDINDFLQDEENWNISRLADENSRFGMEVSAKEVEPDGTSVFGYRLDKDDDVGGTRNVIKFGAGIFVIGFEVKQVGNVINYLVEGQWYYGRDEVANYTDPFDDLVSNDSDDGEIEIEITPGDAPGGDELDDRDWEVEKEWVGEDKGWEILDESRREGVIAHVATSSNGSHETTMIIQDEPRRLLQIVDDNGTEEIRLSLFYETIDISVSTSYPRASAALSVNEIGISDYLTNTTTFEGTLDDGHDQEVLNEEIELRIIDDTLVDEEDDPDYVYLTFAISEGHANLTDDNGDWWDFTWNDEDGDGLVSAGDYYEVTTNTTDALSDYDTRFYDLWADGWEGGPIPGFEAVWTMIALLGAGLLLSIIEVQRRRKGDFSQ